MAKIGHQAKAMYSLCKMVSFARRLKFTKSSEKPLYNQTRVVLCKKRPPPQKANIRKQTAFRKWPKLATKQRLCIAFAKWSVSLED